MKKMAETQSKDKGRDLLFLVMDQCKSMEKRNPFRTGGALWLLSRWPFLQWSNNSMIWKRFCCNSSTLSIMGIDPTFNLGDFNVTPIVYQHLMVRSRQSKSYPWMLGPLFIHYRKEFRNYNFFLSSLVGLRRGLAAIQAAGTDGEKSIIEVLKHQFKDAIFLRCFCHLQQNIERHCKDLSMPPAVIRNYCKEVFGWTGADGTYCEGLVDSRGEEDFHKNLEALQGTWDERERGVLGTDRKPTFYDWFRQEKAYDFCTGSLADQREAAGLGLPPAPFYTNASKSMNSALKEKMNYTRCNGRNSIKR